MKLKNNESATINQIVDFNVTDIIHIIDRVSDASWHIDSAYTSDIYILGLSLDGQAEYTINGIYYTFKKNDIILLPPGTLRSAHSVPENPSHFISIGCTLSFSDDRSRDFMNDLPVYFSCTPETLLLKSRELVKVWFGKQSTFLLKSKSLILDIFNELLQYYNRMRFLPSHYDRVIEAQKYILKNYASSIRINELARHCDFSESHFRRLFYEITGMNCTQYINIVKIDVAKNLLISGSANVSEAAALTGFSDVYYFSKVFKKVTGCPPSAFKS